MLIKNNGSVSADKADKQHSTSTLDLFLASDSKKRANNGAAAIEYMDYFDMAYPADPSRAERFQENFNIHGGRWKNIENIDSSVNITLGNEQISLGSGKLRHYPIEDKVSQAVVADLIISPLIPVIKDNSSKARNHRERMRLEKVQNFFHQTVIQPGLDRATQEFDQQNGVNDPSNLKPEEQKEREFQIQEKFKSETPEEIFTDLERTSTPDELVALALLKEGIRYTKAKTQFNIGAENAVVTAEQYYRPGIINGMPSLEALNPKWVIWGGSENVLNTEDGQFAKYTQYLTPEDAITKYSHHLKKADVKKLAEMYSAIPGSFGDKDSLANPNGVERKLVDMFADNPELNQQVNPKTNDGQEKLKYFYSNLAGGGRSGYGIKETYITWRWMRRVKFVTRMIEGKLDTVIRDEHYRKDPLAGDIEVVDKYIPQAWHGVKLGDEFYIDVNPIPHQYNNINDPFNVKLGIFGGKHNTFQNNVQNASLIDLGKPWQYKYNVLMKKMEEHQATDIGNVFLGTTTMVPKGWSWAQWYKSLFVAKVAIVSNHREGINNLDTSLFRNIDLSRTVDIQSDIRQLEYFENKIVTSMYYSAEKMGAVSEYATNRNTQVAIQGVDRQMFVFHNRNREIKENVLNSFLQLCLYAYKDNEDVKNTVLDDFLRAHYELNYNSVDSSNFTLTVVDDFKESEKLKEMKQLALTFLQNGMTASQLSAVMNAESMHELQRMLEDTDKRIAKESEENFKREESLVEKQRQSAEAQLKLQQEFIKAEADRDREVSIRMAEINSLQLENANDVNRDKINDSLERTVLANQSAEKMQQKQLDQDWKLGNKKIEVEKIKAKQTKK